MNTSLFEIFKIGIGPSSSHTVGPMRAAKKFVESLGERRLLLPSSRVQVELYGSLALTGRGHGTDRAVVLGLCGQDPETVDTATVDLHLSTIRELRALSLRADYMIEFIEPRDLLFHKDQLLPGHTNGMRFQAFDEKVKLAEQIYYSVGGGFIVREGSGTTARFSGNTRHIASSGRWGRSLRLALAVEVGRPIRRSRGAYLYIRIRARNPRNGLSPWN